MVRRLISVENTSVHIQVENKELRLSAAYKRLETQTLISDPLLDTQRLVIVASDLNAKHSTWNSRTNNTEGNIFARQMSNLRNVTVAAPNTPSHYSDIRNHHPDILDIATLKTGNLNFILENLSLVLSLDYSLTILDL